MDDPAVTVRELGETVIENVPVMTKLTVTLWVKLPLVPVITRG